MVINDYLKILIINIYILLLYCYILRHPDRCPPEKKTEAQAKFQEISEAFDVLSDPEKKKIYDQVGSEGLNGGIPEGS